MNALDRLMQTKPGEASYDVFLRDYEERERLYRLLQQVNRDAFLAKDYDSVVSFSDWEYYSHQIDCLTNEERTEAWCDETAQVLQCWAWSDDIIYFEGEHEWVMETLKARKS